MKIKTILDPTVPPGAIHIHAAVPVEVSPGESLAVGVQEVNAEGLPSVEGLQDFHCVFPGAVTWRLQKAGLETKTGGIERTPGSPITARNAWELYGDSIEKWSRHFLVPVELIVATILTETTGRAESVRKEPGYVSDSATPSKISAGLMQTLISTARSTLKDPSITREWLLEPDNAIQAGTSYIAEQFPITDFDPPVVAAAYNAGGVYKQDGARNRWRLRQYPIGTGEHCDRFIKWFNDFFAVIAMYGANPTISFFKALNK